MNRTGIVLGIVVLAGLGIYAMYGNSGNMVVGTKDNAAGSCDLASANAEKLDAISIGDMAAFQISGKSKYVGDLGFKDRQGESKLLSDWKGRTVLLNLWATWCAPCRREMPALEALEVAEGGDDFQVVPVSVDLGEPGKPLKFYDDIGLKDLPFFADGTMAIFNSLKKEGLAFGMPSTLLIDVNSCVLGVLNGPAEWASNDAINLIRAAKKLSGS